MNDGLRDYLGKKKISTKEIEVAAWGGKQVTIRALTAEQHMRVGTLAADMRKAMAGENTKAAVDMSKLPRMMVLVTAFGLGLEENELDLLAAHGEAVQEISTQVMALSGMGGGKKKS